MKLFKLIFAGVVLAMLSACATVQPPAFDESTTTLDLSEQSVFIANVTFDHAVKPSYQPDSVVFYVETPDASGKSERFNLIANGPEILRAGAEGAGKMTFRGQLTPGTYRVTGIGGAAQRVLIYGTFILPLDYEFELKPNEVLYLGDISMTTREREDGEFRAGPVIPLVDQSVSAIAKSTFDVVVADGGEDALSALKSKYPVLQDQTIAVRVLPPFDRSQLDKSND